MASPLPHHTRGQITPTIHKAPVGQPIHPKPLYILLSLSAFSVLAAALDLPLLKAMS